MSITNDDLDWYGFVGTYRDADALQRANYAEATKALEEIDPDGNDWFAATYVHWADGWIEEIYVRPDSPAFYLAEEIRRGLEDYPVISEEALWEEEEAEAEETWRNCFSARERLDYIRKNRSQFGFRDFADLRAQVRGEYFGGYASELLY